MNNAYRVRKRIFRGATPSTFIFRFWSCCGDVELNTRELLNAAADNEDITFKCGCSNKVKYIGEIHQPVTLPAYNVYWRLLTLWAGSNANRLGDTAHRKRVVGYQVDWAEGLPSRRKHY